VTDGRTDRHRVTAYTALMHMHRAVKIYCRNPSTHLAQCVSCEKRETGVEECRSTLLDPLALGAKGADEFGGDRAPKARGSRRQRRWGVGGVGGPSQKIFLTLELKMAGLVHSGCYFYHFSCLFYKRKPMILALGLGILRIRCVHVTSLTESSTHKIT